jgi:hypothetical protein
LSKRPVWVGKIVVLFQYIVRNSAKAKSSNKSLLADILPS